MAKENSVEQEDDFTFGELTTEKTKTETEATEEVTEEKEDEIPEVKDEVAKEETVKEEKEEKKEEDVKTESAVEEEVEDIFAEKDETQSDDKKISLKKIAKEFDVDLEKEDDEVEFKNKFSEKLEKSKQEFKLDGYSDGAKAIIKHLNENGGDIESFFTNNKIAAMQSVLSLDPETKVRNVRLQEVMSEGKSRAEAVTIVDEELKTWATREIKDTADDIDQQAKSLINEEVKKIVGDQELKAAAERQRVEAETARSRNELKSFIEKQDNFLGLGLTPDAKKIIFRDIENGTFDKVLSQNPEQIKFASYMFSKYGAKIMKRIEGSLQEQNRKGYNAATRKALDALHKTEDSVKQSKTGHTPARKDTETGNKPKWSKEDFE